MTDENMDIEVQAIHIPETATELAEVLGRVLEGRTFTEQYEFWMRFRDGYRGKVREGDAVLAPALLHVIDERIADLRPLVAVESTNG